MTHDVTLAQQVARADRWKRLTQIVAASAALLVVGLQLWLTVSVRDTQLDGTPTGKAILETSDAIKSCTTPGAPCYERGQRAQSGAIASINEITIYAVTCGQQNPDASVNVVQACVEKLYKQNHPK